jgi:hypothetical protein
MRIGVNCIRIWGCVAIVDLASLVGRKVTLHSNISACLCIVAAFILLDILSRGAHMVPSNRRFLSTTSASVVHKTFGSNNVYRAWRTQSLSNAAAKDLGEQWKHLSKDAGTSNGKA